MKFGNVYVNQADISFASKVDVNVTFSGPALPPEEPPLGKLGMGLGLALNMQFITFLKERNFLQNFKNSLLIFHFRIKRFLFMTT